MNQAAVDPGSAGSGTGGRGAEVGPAAGVAMAGSLIAVLFSIGLAGGAAAQEVRDLTVEESVRLGLEHNAGLRAAEADAAAAEAVYEQARAGRLPAMRSQASYTRLSDNIPAVEFMLPGLDSTFTVQAVELDRVHAEVSVEVPLLTQLRLRHESRAAEHGMSAAELLAEQERADVAFAIRRAYWTLYRATAVRAMTDAAIERVETHLGEVRSRLAEGAALNRDLLSAQTRRSEVLLERVEAENAVRVARLELNRLIGLPLDAPVRATSEVEVAAPEPAPTIPTPAVVGERPEIGALREQVGGLREEWRAARATRYPDLDFLGRWVYARPNPYFFADQDAFRSTWELMLSARWSIWEGGRVRARAREARSRLEAAEARRAETRERVAVDVARLRLEVERATEAMGVAAENVREAEESYRVVRQQFAEGVALSSDVLDAEEALRRANARRAEALADYAIARAAVLNALGRTW